MSSGLRAFAKGEDIQAAATFDRVIAGINVIYADTEEARKARSLWYAEEEKLFKGEPYERAMAFYYRGLLFLRSGDYENARASFRSGLLQDAFAEEQQHRADFALLLFLDAWASQCLDADDMAEEAYAELVEKRHRPDFIIPDRDHDLLVVVETGDAPRKLADGVGHYQLKYRPGRNPQEKSVRLLLSGQSVSMYPMEDIYLQAATRGGRAVDHIIGRKVTFRRGAQKVASVLTQASSISMLLAPAFGEAAGDVRTVAGAAGIVGTIAWAGSVAARPEADTRRWDNLPGAVHVLTMKQDDAPKEIPVRFLDSGGRMLNGLSRTVVVPGWSAGCGLAWLRSRNVE